MESYQEAVYDEWKISMLEWIYFNKITYLMLYAKLNSLSFYWQMDLNKFFNNWFI